MIHYMSRSHLHATFEQTRVFKAQHGTKLPMAGMRPLGLILRNHSSFCSFLDREMGCTLHFRPSSSIKMLAFQPFGVPAVYKVMPFLVDILRNVTSSIVCVLLCAGVIELSTGSCILSDLQVPSSRSANHRTPTVGSVRKVKLRMCPLKLSLRSRTSRHAET